MIESDHYIEEKVIQFNMISHTQLIIKTKLHKLLYQIKCFLILV